MNNKNSNNNHNPSTYKSLINSHLKNNVKKRKRNKEDIDIYNNKVSADYNSTQNVSKKQFKGEEYPHEGTNIKQNYQTVEFFIGRRNRIIVKPSNAIIAKHLGLKRGAVYNLKDNSWEISDSLYENLLLKLNKEKINVIKLPEGVLQILKKEITRKKESEFTLEHPIYSKLLSFQKESVIFALNRNGRVLLGDDMGLGKTVQALAIAQYYSKEFPLLVIAPASLLENWKEAISSFLDADSAIIRGKIDFGERISIISYTMATKYHELITNNIPGVIICDECHYLKNNKAMRTSTLLPILTSVSRLIMLSGTPALSRPIELFPIISAINPQIFPNYNQYGGRYCDGKLVYIPSLKREIYNFKGSSYSEELKFVLEKAMMIRRLKSSVLNELPSKYRRHIVLSLNKSSKLKKPAFTNIEGILGENVNSDIMAHYNEAAKLKQKPVVDYLEELIEKNIKFIVFAHHQEMMNSLADFLTKKTIKFIKIDGSTPTSKRFGYVESFQSDNDIRVALLSLTACSTGITLTAATAVVFSELYWNPGTLLQAEDRIYRIGQKSCVDIHYLICRGTIDEIVWPKLFNKMDVLDKLGVGENVYSGPEYDKREIKNILKKK